MQPNIIKMGSLVRALGRTIAKNNQVSYRGISITSTARAENSFKVQDPKDFNDRVKNSKVPVIVDFFATWCNPCRMLTPRLETVIAENKGKVILAKVDIDENTDLALDYEVGSVPVLMVFTNGKAGAKLVGLQDTDKLRKFVDKAIGDSADISSK